MVKRDIEVDHTGQEVPLCLHEWPMEGSLEIHPS